MVPKVRAIDKNTVQPPIAAGFSLHDKDKAKESKK